MLTMDYYANHAELYDYLAPGIEGDVEFYVDEAKRAGSPVLELACGTGRVLIPIAKAGLEITGVDISPAMLAVAKERTAALPEDMQSRITLLQGDMSDLSLGRKFKVAIIAYSSFLHILTPEDQRRTLNGIREHLDEGGRLIISMFDPRWDIIAAHMGPGGTSPRLLKRFRNEATGRETIVWDSRQYNPGNQTVIQYRIFEELDEHSRVVNRYYADIELRWSYRWEMQYLFELCGFEVESLYSDFKRTPFVPGTQQIWVARRAR